MFWIKTKVAKLVRYGAPFFTFVKLVKYVERLSRRQDKYLLTPSHLHLPEFESNKKHGKRGIGISCEEIKRVYNNAIHDYSIRPIAFDYYGGFDGATWEYIPSEEEKVNMEAQN